MMTKSNNKKRREKMKIGIAKINEGQDFLFFNFFFFKANIQSLLTKRGILEYF